MSLYALIDFYTKGLIIELTSIISQERAYKYSQKMPKASKNPVNAINKAPHPYKFVIYCLKCFPF